MTLTLTLCPPASRFTSGVSSISTIGPVGGGGGGGGGTGSGRSVLTMLMTSKAIHTIYICLCASTSAQNKVNSLTVIIEYCDCGRTSACDQSNSWSLWGELELDGLVRFIVCVSQNSVELYLRIARVCSEHKLSWCTVVVIINCKKNSHLSVYNIILAILLWTQCFKV